MKPTRKIRPAELNGIAALRAAMDTPLRKGREEKDTEFVKRIVCAYLNALQTVLEGLR